MSCFQRMTSHASHVSALLAVCLCLFICVDAARLPLRTPVYIENENSLSPVAKYGAPPVYEVRDWVRIKNSGPRMNRVSLGGRLELECEANGSPPPSVQWFHNAAPASQEMDENNSIGGLRLGTVRTRLVVDCATPRHQGTYTCVATAGTETVISQPSLVMVQGNNASGLLPSCDQDSASPPRILTWNPSTMETIGNDVVLPCISTGNPRPRLYWIDSQNSIISSRSEGQSDDRYKILDSGDLLISTVRWSDMGHFTCVVESPLGRDSVTTFLYPMAKDR
uniref:Ig-like domain-containing protein n=1 Tax=Cuerna arida TaxID=1464854 RepID=A0A1B6GQB6_9HEMI